MIPTSRCTVYPRYFYRRLFVQRALRNTSGNGVPSRWITRGVAWRAGEKKRKTYGGETGDGWRMEDTVEERSESEASDRAITGNETRERGEKMMVASTPRIHAGVYIRIYIYIYVSPRDVGLSSCPMMDVYHVRQRPRHLLHHHHRRSISSSLFLFSHSPFLSRCQLPSARLHSTSFCRFFSAERVFNKDRAQIPRRGKRSA